MPHAYCTTCKATVTVSDNRCLAGHEIDGPIIKSARGRHRAPSRWEQLIPGRSAAGQHRGRQPRQSTPPLREIAVAEVREMRPAARQTPKPEPKPTRQAPKAPPPRPVQPPSTQPSAPVRPAATQLAAPESISRSVYSSSMLEMLGLDEDAGFEPTITTMASPQPVWQPPAPVPANGKTGLDRLPALSDMRMVNDNHADTGTLIERLWVATAEHEAVQPAANLSAPEFQTVPDRTFRWTIVIGAVLGLALAVTLLQVGVRLPDRMAEQATTSYRSAVIEAQDVLPAATEVMIAITDPAVGNEALSDAAVTLSRLDTASRNLFTYASEPLAATPPLVPREALDALTPVRSDMAQASQDGLAIERRLGDALTYRLVFGRAFVLPELPSTASPDEISALGVELGLGLAGTLDALAALPNDPAFESHRAQAELLASRYADWQIEYLTALRSGDLATATELVQELEGSVERITTGIVEPLQTVAGWATVELDKFDTTLSRLLGNLG